MSTASEAPGAGEAGAPVVLTRATLAYTVVRWSVWTWLTLVHRMRVEGREHLPRAGGALVVSNHQSTLDIPLLAAAIPRHVSFVARASLARSRPLAWLMRQCGAVLLERAAVDRAALREMAEHLRLGDCVAIFPEGTRSLDGSLGEFRRGALFGARQTEAPLIPAAVHGTFEAWPRHRAYPLPHRVGVRFGPAVDPRRPDALEEVRARVAAMLAEDART